MHIFYKQSRITLIKRGEEMKDAEKSYSKKALTGVKSIDANIEDFTNLEEMERTINDAIHNLNKLKSLIQKPKPKRELYDSRFGAADGRAF
jgi:chaperonin GroEL (HSP60 family)